MEDFDKLYCVIKTSGLDFHHSTEERAQRFKKLSIFKQEMIRRSDENQKKFIETFQKNTKELNLDVDLVYEHEMDLIKPTKNDLVFACGGDGTFLNCAQLYQESVLIGLNSDYQGNGRETGSYGALTSTNKTNLKQNLLRLIQQDYTIEKWNRLQATVNGEKIPKYAVNEIYFGQKVSYETCNTKLVVNEMEEDFQCSGVIVCTGMGSHAWFYNAGGSPFSNELDAFGFMALIPNIKRPLKFSSGVVSKRNELNIYPNRDGYIISFDSTRDVIETNMGDEIKISLAHNCPVRVVTFP